jgi:hypothetical protein
MQGRHRSVRAAKEDGRMTEQMSWLPVEHRRDQLGRLDTASIMKRFFFLERALVIACAAWITGVGRLESKAMLARAAWQNTMVADAERRRVLELRYPDRTLEVGGETSLVGLFGAALNAPSGPALLRAMERVFVPAMLAAYEEYLGAADDIADGPSRRFLEQAIRDKGEQRKEFGDAAEVELRVRPELRDAADEWTRGLASLLDRLGGVTLEEPSAEVEVPEVVEPGRKFRLSEDPVRDDRYCVTDGLYWPDNFDPDYGYGDGFRLQLRSAVAHLNEVWAVETAGALLEGYADELGWEFVVDAARWLYDEGRHMMMGKQRLEDWGFDPKHIPLGGYIYQAANGEDLIYRLGMLGYFETKNIGKKQDRAREFGEHGDTTSQRDMDFDWADEAIHAGYGRRWLRRALELRGESPDDWKEILQRCEQLAAARVSRATEEEKDAVRACTENLIADAEQVIERAHAI